MLCIDLLTIQQDLAVGDIIDIDQTVQKRGFAAARGADHAQ